MTKLADAIRRSQRIESAPMGFGAARPASRPTMVVGALAKATESLQAYRDAGADVIVIDARGATLSTADAQKLGADGNDRSRCDW
jgi:adenine/guanine phosphoribosyltransferase-like PRPP-binding protein